MNFIMKISIWILVILFSPRSCTVHVGVKPAGSKRAVGIGLNPKQSVGVLPEPQLPNCSEPVCVGPLSEIYCNGKLIHTTWMFGMQERCPGDMLRKDPEDVLAEFNKLKFPLRREVFKEFCDNNFADISYLKPAKLVDWTEEPENVRSIKDPHLKKFASKLNLMWKSLGREFISQVKDKPDRFPVLPVPNPFVVPGGFFQIYFYWDSYWIIKGLLFSNMTLTSRQIIDNFASIVALHGFIPNSGSVQLSRRSQPPLFTQMVADYFSATQNKSFLVEMLPYMEAELSWWRVNRTTTVLHLSGSSYSLFQYRSPTNCPRPESYTIDLSNGLNGTGDSMYIWSSIASACESGSDFSSRWFAYEGKRAGTKFSIRTNSIIPVDLNVYMAWNYLTLAELCKILGIKKKTEKYQKLAAELQLAIDNVLWNDSDGVWFDYDIAERSHRRRFYPSNIFPLILKNSSTAVMEKVLQYLLRNDVLQYKGGIPCSMEESKEQWDFPNEWAPSVYIFVESLLRTGHEKLFAIGKEVAKKFVLTVYNGLMNPLKGMPAACWEKYDVRYDDGRPGKGGEYPVQQGFGWTNGAVLDMILRFYVERNEPFILFPAVSTFPPNYFGRPPHSYIVAAALTLCISLSIWFTARSCRAHFTGIRRGDRFPARASRNPEERLLIADRDSE